MFANFVNRVRAFSNVCYHHRQAAFLVNRRVRLSIARDSRVDIEHGRLMLGYPLPCAERCASYQQSHLILNSGSRIVVAGDVCIAPGFTIRLAAGAQLYLGGCNHISHNFFLLCRRRCVIGKDTQISWHVTMIDNDGHQAYNVDREQSVSLPNRELVIGSNVGLQMQVTIPRGVTIGDNSVLSAATVVRRDVPANSVVYSDHQLRVNRRFCNIPIPNQPPLKTTCVKVQNS